MSASVVDARSPSVQEELRSDGTVAPAQKEVVKETGWVVSDKVLFFYLVLLKLHAANVNSTQSCT